MMMNRVHRVTSLRVLTALAMVLAWAQAGAQTTLMERILFEVKKVEEFAADDPKNPKNIQPAKKHTDD